jgi:hypothetical protein
MPPATIMPAMMECVCLLVALLQATVRDRGDLVAENLLLRQQLAVLTRPTRAHPHLRARDKLVWLLVRVIRRDWRHHLVLVRPETVVRWHRQGWRLFWRWKSRARLGRPRLSAEIRELIAAMATENPTWGSERIVGELLKLGIAVSKRSVQPYRRRGPARPPGSPAFYGTLARVLPAGGDSIRGVRPWARARAGWSSTVWSWTATTSFSRPAASRSRRAARRAGRRARGCTTATGAGRGTCRGAVGGCASS